MSMRSSRVRNKSGKNFIHYFYLLDIFTFFLIFTASFYLFKIILRDLLVTTDDRIAISLKVKHCFVDNTL